MSIIEFKKLKEVKDFCESNDLDFNEVINNISKTSESEYCLYFILIYYDSIKKEFKYSFSFDKEYSRIKPPNRYDWWNMINLTNYNFRSFLGKEFEDLFTIKMKITEKSKKPSMMSECTRNILESIPNIYKYSAELKKEKGKSVWDIEYINIKRG